MVATRLALSEVKPSGELSLPLNDVMSGADVHLQRQGCTGFLSVDGGLVNGFVLLVHIALGGVGSGAPITNVRVWIQEVPKENWGISRVSAKDLGR